jgi:hypothetical protein
MALGRDGLSFILRVAVSQCYVPARKRHSPAESPLSTGHRGWSRSTSRELSPARPSITSKHSLSNGNRKEMSDRHAQSLSENQPQ